MKSMQKELADLMTFSGKPEFETKLNDLRERRNSDTDRDELMAALKSGIVKCKDDIIKVDVKLQLAEVSEMLSLSYIAKKYFGKTRQWFYQRLNGNKVNGKVYTFSKEEIATLNYAIKDISKKLSSLSIG